MVWFKIKVGYRLNPSFIDFLIEYLEMKMTKAVR